MILSLCRVIHTRAVGENIFLLRFSSPALSSGIKPGQFLNIRVSEGTDPLLRRPFSVYRVDGDDLEIIFSVIGRGTNALSQKRENDILDILGPLGTPYTVASDSYVQALLVAGGLGVAPLPILTRALQRAQKKIATFVGARSRSALVTDHLENVQVATDDGSQGFRGTVVDLLRSDLSRGTYTRPKIFACGPTAMLRAVADAAREFDVPCEVSLEGAMACGFGICQGCPVELTDGPQRYALMCKDGPVFDTRRIKI